MESWELGKYCLTTDTLIIYKILKFVGLMNMNLFNIENTLCLKEINLRKLMQETFFTQKTEILWHLTSGEDRS